MRDEQSHHSAFPAGWLASLELEIAFQGGASVCATLTAVGPALPAALQAQIRALDPALGASQLKSVFMARLLCGDSERARHVMTRAWQLLRPHLIGRAALAPRIWAT